MKDERGTRGTGEREGGKEKVRERSGRRNRRL